MTISIHAPRGGSDNLTSTWSWELQNFNPRSPWGERLFSNRGGVGSRAFQSTLPVGGATKRHEIIHAFLFISIHAPRGGSDHAQALPTIHHRDFNPRSPWGERPFFSCHALISSNFNPRSPWGERLAIAAQKWTWRIFQSTLPVGGATKATDCFSCPSPFQSTLPVGGATMVVLLSLAGSQFQSTLPVGGATRTRVQKSVGSWDFNPRSPWGERPGTASTVGESSSISIHAPRGGSDLGYCGLYVPSKQISIHAPRGGSDRRI